MIAPNLPYAVALGTTAFAIAFAGIMDADPSLYIYDKFFVNERKLKRFFQGKSIWITGASSGIGRELAVRASRYGVKNLILTGRSQERLQLVADYCSDQNKESSSNVAPSTISVLPLDMTAPMEDFETAISSLENILGDDNLDCVLLNAGRGQLKPADRTSASTTSEIFQINALAPIALTQQLLERGILKKTRGKQQLVVTSSVGAIVGLPLSSSYAASKHAVQGYFNTLRAEQTWLDIKLICPGTIDTSFHSSYVGGSGPRGDSAKDSNAGDKTIQKSSSNNKLKMSIDRCVRLYMSSLMMRNSEFWIAAQPMLSGLYINRFFPGIFQALLAKVGTLRIKAWEEGKDLYDPKTWKEMGKRK